MLNEKRIRQMTKLAQYEGGKGKEALEISRYFRGDYLGKELLKNFFVATFGYALVVGVLALYHMEWLMDEMDSVNLVFLIGCLTASYLCFLAVYSAVVYGVRAAKYEWAKKSVREYYRRLGELQRMYDAEDGKRQRTERRRTGK